jgi:hypothetical protein
MSRRLPRLPDSCIVIDSLSKKVAPGLALGSSCPRSGCVKHDGLGAFGWMDSLGICVAAAQRMMATAPLPSLKLKRLDARAAETGGRSSFGFEIQTNENAIICGCCRRIGARRLS